MSQCKKFIGKQQDLNLLFAELDSLDLMSLDLQGVEDLLKKINKFWLLRIVKDSEKIQESLLIHHEDLLAKQDELEQEESPDDRLSRGYGLSNAAYQ